MLTFAGARLKDYRIILKEKADDGKAFSSLSSWTDRMCAEVDAEELAAARPIRGWGTFEGLILAGAVLRHGVRDWNVVALEVQSRTINPNFFTSQACKAKYEELRKRYGSTVWFEELRRQRMAELKRELARYDDSIGSLEWEIKHLKTEKQDCTRAGYGSGQSESPLPTSNMDSPGTSGKEISKGEHSAGSITKDTGTCEHRDQVTDADDKLDTSVSFEKDYKLGVGMQGVTVRKKRGQRKRRSCSGAGEKGSLGEGDNVLLLDVASCTQKEASVTDSEHTISEHTVRVSGKSNCSGSSNAVKRHNLMDIFQAIAPREPAMVFRHRMDSQKRARYRKVIKQHLDIGTIRSKILRKSITSAKELFRDLLLLANNALVFYSRRTREYKSALSLRLLVMEEYKQYCRGSYHEATSAFPPFHPPVKARSARPRPRPRPQAHPSKVLEKISSVDYNLVTINRPQEVKKACDSDYKLPLVPSLKGKKGLKRPLKAKTELAEKRFRYSEKHKNRKRKVDK